MEVPRKNRRIEKKSTGFEAAAQIHQYWYI